jgi:hypothetical protein
MSDIPVLDGEISVWNWEAPGPVAEAYLMAVDPVTAIMGPQGSGKTTTSVLKCAKTSLQMPLCKDGVIRARGCVVRDNYRALYRTTLQTWFGVFPREFPGSKFEGGQDRPAKHTIVFRTPRGQLVEMIVDFYAVGDHAIEELLKGYEPSWCWMNEMDMLHDRVPTFLYGRTGRYPPALDRADPEAPILRHVFGDLNPPDVDHWIYRDFVDPETKQFGHELYRQPSGLSDQAENRAGVPRSKYEEDSRTMKKADVRRLVHGEFGYASDGRPVYDGVFSERVHVADSPLEVLQGRPLHGGYDQGLSPAFIPFQIADNGQIRVLGELAPDHGTGPGRFCEMLIAMLLDRFRGLPLGVHTADPAGFYGADRIAGEMAWVETVMRAIGHPIQPAPSQEPGIRIESLTLPLTTMIDAHSPGIIIDPRCRMIIGGMAAHYKYRRIRQGTRDAYTDRPDKNAYSHPMEALQYGVLGVRGRAGIINASAQARRAGNVIPMHNARPASADFDVWGV